MGRVRVVVLADTHAPRRWKTSPPAVAACLRDAGLILHAGDVCTARVLDELAGYAPVLAVKGNNDGRDVAAWARPTGSKRASRASGWPWCTTRARRPAARP